MDDLRSRVIRAIQAVEIPEGGWPEDRAGVWLMALDEAVKAADTALAEMGGVRVRNLVWDERHRADDYRVQYTYGQDQKDYLLTRGGNIVWAYDTVDEAKAAAQADYETRILAAIEPARAIAEGKDDE